MKYVSNPITNSKAQLAFRGIIINENLKGARELNAVVELEKCLQEINEVRNANGEQVSFRVS